MLQTCYRGKQYDSTKTRSELTEFGIIGNIVVKFQLMLKGSLFFNRKVLRGKDSKWLIQYSFAIEIWNDVPPWTQKSQLYLSRVSMVVTYGAASTTSSTHFMPLTILYLKHQIRRNFINLWKLKAYFILQSYNSTFLARWIPAVLYV